MEIKELDGNYKKNIHLGSEVKIVQKQDQESGELTVGWVERILTKASHHTYGIKVQLETGEVGRVKNILPPI